jgi:hypothetical protein
MSRDFILIFSGGMVSLVTTLIVLFIVDYLYRREQMQRTKLDSLHPPETVKPAQAPEDKPA